MRIVSFLPSGTEMVCALGLEDALVGISHECDYPESVRGKPVVVRSAIPTDTMTPLEIDRAVSERLRAGNSLYLVDEVLLQQIAPDLIVTQDLCQVCAPSGNEASQAIQALKHKPKVLYLTPKNLSEIFENLLEVGDATGKQEAAQRLVHDLQGRVERMRERSAGLKRPRVFIFEWFDPPYCAGHWMAEITELAGGEDRLATRGEDSVRVPWEKIREYAPEVLVLSPCGYRLDAALREAERLQAYPGWDELPAVKNNRVYAVDASHYFARPGPRVVTGMEILAEIFHPEVFRGLAPLDSYRRFEPVRV